MSEKRSYKPHSSARLVKEPRSAQHSVKKSLTKSSDRLPRLLTPKRLELWRLIRDKRPPSVLKLSLLSERDSKSVHRDLRVLVSLGIVRLEPVAHAKGQAVRPVSLMDSIQMEVK